jgi:phosphoribosylformylglycinamidine (FGAM) synthase PurS component
MEKLITLTLEEYNQLLKYKDVFDNKKTVYINMFDKNSISYPENEAIEKLIDELKKFEKEYNRICGKFIELQLENKILENKVEKLKKTEELISKISKFENLPWYKRIFYNKF